MQEIERRFLVKNIDNISLEKYSKKIIEQDYIYNDKLTAIRKRKIIKEGQAKYYYTIKTNTSSIYSQEELEFEIDEETYIKLDKREDRNTIIKDRYNIPIQDGLIIELDIFHGIFEGVIFAEIEFPSEEMARTFLIPRWFDKELTGKLSNSQMTKMTKEEFDKKIEKI